VNGNTFHPAIQDLVTQIAQYLKGKTLSFTLSDSDETIEVKIPKIFNKIFQPDSEQLAKHINILKDLPYRSCEECLKNFLSAFIDFFFVLGSNNEFDDEYEQYIQKISTIYQPLITYYNEIMKNIKEIGKIFSRRSITSAYFVTRYLEEVEDEISQNNEGEVTFRVENPFVHLVWASLADANDRDDKELIPRITDFDSKVDEVSAYLSRLARELKNSKDLTVAVSNYAIKGEEARSEIEKVISGLVGKLPDSNLPERDKGILNEYVIAHLLAFAENYCKQRKGDIKDLDTYLKLTFLQNGFLEYEAYNAFLKNDFLAFPRIQVRYSSTASSYKEETIDYHGEIDVAFLYNNYQNIPISDYRLLIVEVTSRSYSTDIKEKCENLSKVLGTPLGRYIAGVIIIGKNDLPPECPENFIPITFSELYSDMRYKIKKQLAEISPQPEYDFGNLFD
jgi:hypothetical protein